VIATIGGSIQDCRADSEGNINIIQHFINAAANQYLFIQTTRI
jgi:hypothetical protein